MKTVTLDVRSFEDVIEDSKAALRARKPQGARISFATPELLWKILTVKRWELLRALCGKEPMTLREAAKLVDRDVKVVHGDETALIKAGVLRREEAGVVFPYDAIKVEFLVRAA